MLMTFWANEDSLLGGGEGAAVCICVLYPPDASSTSLPNFDNQKCLQMSPDVPWVAKSPPIETC